MSDGTIPEVVGRAIRAIREKGGYSQDDLADAARRAGLDWTRGSVASLETERRGLSAEEFLLLPLAFVFLDGGSHTLRDLLDGPDEIVRSTGTPMGAGFLRHLLEGGDAAAVGILERTLAAGWGDLADDLLIPYMAAREAERHVAKALGISAEKVAERAYRRWGHGLTEEREQRVGERSTPDASPRSLQAVRGHVTRELLEELREEMKGAKDA